MLSDLQRHTCHQIGSVGVVSYNRVSGRVYLREEVSSVNEEVLHVAHEALLTPARVAPDHKLLDLQRVVRAL